MGNLEKIFVMLMCANFFMYIYLGAAESTQNASLLNLFLDLESNNPGSLAGTLPSSVSSDTAVVGTDTLSIASPIRMVWNFLDGILTYLFAPAVVISTIPNLPIQVAQIFCLPYFIMLMFGIVGFIRGKDA